MEELCNEHPDCGLHLLDLRYPPNINRDSIRKLVSASELSNDNADNPLSVAIYSLNLDRLSLEESLEFLNTLDDTNENATSKVHIPFKHHKSGIFRSGNLKRMSC